MRPSSIVDPLSMLPIFLVHSIIDDWQDLSREPSQLTRLCMGTDRLSADAGVYRPAIWSSTFLPRRRPAWICGPNPARRIGTRAREGLLGRRHAVDYSLHTGRIRHVRVAGDQQPSGVQRQGRPVHSPLRWTGPAGCARRMSITSLLWMQRIPTTRRRTFGWEPMVPGFAAMSPGSMEISCRHAGRPAFQSSPASRWWRRPARAISDRPNSTARLKRSLATPIRKASLSTSRSSDRMD